MAAASIETPLELWASSLRDVKARMRGLFTQERVAGHSIYEPFSWTACWMTSGARQVGAC